MSDNISWNISRDKKEESLHTCMHRRIYSRRLSLPIEALFFTLHVWSFHPGMFWLFFFFFKSLRKKRKKKPLLCSYIFAISWVSSGWEVELALPFLSLVALRFTSFVLRTLLFEILLFKSAGSKGWWAPALATALGQRIFFLNNSLMVLFYFIFPWNVSWICWFVKGSSEVCSRPLFFIVFWLFYFSLTVL